MLRDVHAKIWTNMSWANMGWASSAHETGTWEYRRARCVAPAKSGARPYREKGRYRLTTLSLALSKSCSPTTSKQRESS
jgi:hypothetical protein